MPDTKTRLSQKYIGEGALLLMTIFWGVTFPVIKEALDDVSSMIFIASRFSLASLILFFFVRKRLHLINSKLISTGIFLGVLLFLGFGFQTVGLNYTSATKSGFITGSLVVMIPFLQFLIRKKIPTKGALLGTILVFIGILFLSTGGSDIFTFLEDLGSDFNFGDFLTLACAFFFALHVVYIDLISNEQDVLSLVFFQLFTTAILALIFSSIFSIGAIEQIKFSVTSDLIFAIIYTAVFATLINLALQTKYQRVVSPTKAGILYSFEPIFAGIFAFFLLNEKISNFGFIGSALIFAGLLVAEAFDSITKQNENSTIAS
ncbi:MAG: DMT family transporter [Melioribacteraceae bacterium]|nr:DMT family transporter [Melioribacteraceae bacterium]MCF8265261.1 DMT family transporter [Melioribacteraceae bacterium]MCF8414169.1 DMT family transporter [Melioribacteraceae bacterium]MCF8432534.1 DMT family transporter [Melioribacteraceae bacterium]